VLHCVYYKRQEDLEAYVLKCKKIDINVINNLVERGYLSKFEGDITFSKLNITTKAIRDFDLLDDKTHEQFFEEIKACYPSQIKKNGVVVRRLHQNIDACRKKYKMLIQTKEQHDLILKCTKLYIDEQKKAYKLEFTLMLETFLNQKHYKIFEEEALKNKLENVNYEDHDVI
jgi:DNA-binding Lrp family transcriptional regulator